MTENNFKRYIYISTENRAIIEDICKEKGMILATRFINEYDLSKFLQTELRNINFIHYLILDLNSFTKLTKEDEIIKKLTLIRKMYNSRVIIIAEGYKQGNILLGKIFNLGIYNIITATDDVKFREEFEKTLSEDGMTFGNSIKYKIDSQVLAVNQNTKLVRENYIKVKQNVNIGIAGVEKHIGATTVAVNLTKYLSELPNIRACYIENNSNDSLLSIIEDEESIFAKDTRKITYQGIEMFLKPKTMSDILACDYNFYIYDYGALTEMSEEEKNSFMTRDLKILVAGNKIWEVPNLINAFQIIGEDPTTYLLFNFVSNEEKEEFRKSLGDYWSKRCMFSELVLNPFQVKNRDFYAKVLKLYLLENEIIEKKKKFKIWSKKRK